MLYLTVIGMETVDISLTFACAHPDHLLVGFKKHWLRKKKRRAVREWLRNFRPNKGEIPCSLQLCPKKKRTRTPKRKVPTSNHYRQYHQYHHHHHHHHHNHHHNNHHHHHHHHHHRHHFTGAKWLLILGVEQNLRNELVLKWSKFERRWILMKILK